MQAMPRRKTTAGRVGPVGPPNPVRTPMGRSGETCEIIYGHNVQTQRVLMQFSRAADRLIFTPEEAEHVARQLLHYAEAARGKKPS